MSKARNVLTFLCKLLVAQGLHAQRQELEAFPALMNLIRGEKFDVILPQVMEDNGIDMWIHVIRGEDPLNFEFGDNSGIYIFTDRGEARIERAVLGGQADRELYDVFGPESDLGQFVADRDPISIALNYGEEEGSGFDTISTEDRTQILAALGDEYRDRVVSANRLIADFLAGRVMSEVALYGRLLINSTNIIESEFEKIVPGETRLSDIAGNVFVGTSMETKKIIPITWCNLVISSGYCTTRACGNSVSTTVALATSFAKEKRGSLPRFSGYGDML